ncbi:MAG: flagellar protein FliS [bacterium]
MNGYNTSLINYKKNQILPADQKTLILLMYDGAINFLTQAKPSIKEKKN